MGLWKNVRRKSASACMLVCCLLFCCVDAWAETPGQLIFPDETDPLVLQWGDVVVQEFLATHQLPVTEVDSIKSYARQDLRDNLRSFAWVKLQLLLTDANRPLDAVEERMLNRYAEVVKQIDTEALKLARDEKNRFLSNRCNWKPDPDLSKSSGYTYDGTYYCPRPPYSPMFESNPPVSPHRDYFLAFGQKKSWLETIAARPGGTRSIAHISQAGILHLGIGLGAALVLGIALPL